MSAKIRGELFKRLQEAEKSEPQQEVPVIVTITAGADLAELERKGLKIQRVFEAISAVSGTLTVSEITEIAQMDQVETIEYDGEVWAL